MSHFTNQILGRDEAGLNHWLKHLSEKVWFDSTDFLAVRNKALKSY